MDKSNIYFDSSRDRISQSTTKTLLHLVNRYKYIINNIIGSINQAFHDVATNTS
jgi:hypothetical protein